jgi:hypothetical protein
MDLNWLFVFIGDECFQDNQAGVIVEMISAMGLGGGAE